MKFTKGERYDGGSIIRTLEADWNSGPYYGLHRGDDILGFALTRWQNPDAPREVLVGHGDGREKYADWFIKHKPHVPVFIKEREDDGDWLCAGEFRLADVSDEPLEKNKRVKPFVIPSIYKILFLEEVR
jgi:hypothetical protein